MGGGWITSRQKTFRPSRICLGFLSKSARNHARVGMRSGRHGRRQVARISFESIPWRPLLGVCRASWRAHLQFAFDGYVFDPDRRELTRGSEAIAIGPQVFDLLAHLLRNRARVVSKDDLIE